MERTYIAIDLKSFYASVECVERGLDPLTTNLVVADKSRTNKTICLAVSPSLKSFGVSGRPRLFEVEQKVKNVNRGRDPYHVNGSSYFLEDLEKDPTKNIDYLIAPPRMGFYIEYSTKIYNIYLKYIAPEDIHVYSIDEVFIDITNYMKLYQMNAHELAMHMIQDVLNHTGITATCGIGTNMYLAKVAMDIVAKKMPADKDGVRIAELDEMEYRKQLWDHKPITDFWRVGAGYARRLDRYGLYTMGDIARFSLTRDGELYDEFGINAELLIDHAWGYEPCTMKDIKSYTPQNNSLSSGQVLSEGYTYEKAELVMKEMSDNLALDLVQKGLMCDQVGLYIGYDIKSDLSQYDGDMAMDWYGRKAPKAAHGSIALEDMTSSSKEITEALLYIYHAKVDPSLLVRRINITAGHVVPVHMVKKKTFEQIDLFVDADHKQKYQEEKEKAQAREKKAQEAILQIKNKFGKNAVLKAMDLEDKATTIERNDQIGGHKK